MKTKLTSIVLAVLLCVVSLLPIGGVSSEKLAMAEPLTTGSETLTIADVSAHIAGASTTAAVDATTDGTFETAEFSPKEEVIYTMLKGDGSVTETYAVNHFTVTKAGEIIDFGDYAAVENLTSTAALEVKGDSVSAYAELGEFYYQGTQKQNAIPWQISIEYILNGKQIDARELAGKSGKLQINIKTAQNSQVDAVFFENYLLQIQLSIPASVCKGLVAEGAQVASAGKDTQVVFMVMPGKEGSLSLSADVTGFEMAGVQVSALPFSMVFDVADTSEMTTDMSDLSDAISVLNDGVSELSAGMAKLQEGSKSLESGSSELKGALWQLSDSADQLSAASGEIDAALAEISAQLKSGSVDTDDLATLIAAVRTLGTGLSNDNPAAPGLAQALAQIQGTVSASIVALDDNLSQMQTVDAASIEALMADPYFSSLLAQSQTTVQDLVTVNAAAAAARSIWLGTNGTDGVKATIETSTYALGDSANACRTMAAQLSLIADGLESGLGSLEDLNLLVGYMEQLSGEFSSFSAGLSTYSQGASAVAESYSSFDDGLKAYLNGTDGLYGGIVALSEGTNELHINTADLPQVLQDEIDAFLADYTTADFELKSFVSEKNKAVERVQFIMIGEAVEVIEPEDPPPTAEPDPDFWGRLGALFGL